MARQVTIYLRTADETEMVRVALRTPVWVADVEANRAAVEKIWRAADEWPHVQLTLFRWEARPHASDWRHLLEQIELHHGPAAERLPYDTIEVVGTPLTASAFDALTDAGFEIADEAANGFRATKRREEPAQPRD